MLKPQGYDEAQAFTGEYETLEPGGYICKIIKAEEGATRNGARMLVLYFDIAEGDRADFYKRQFERQMKLNDKTKWQGVYRQLVDGNSTPYYKGMMTSIEESNAGYKWNHEEQTLKGKLFGGVFGREEYLDYEGMPRMTTKCMGIRSIDTVRSGVKAPADKLLSDKQTLQPSMPYSPMDVSDDDLPF